MMKTAYDLLKVKEAIESKFSVDEIEKAETTLRRKAREKNIPYVTYLRVIGQAPELHASVRLLGIYLLYIK